MTVLGVVPTRRQSSFHLPLPLPFYPLRGRRAFFSFLILVAPRLTCPPAQTRISSRSSLMHITVTRTSTRTSQSRFLPTSRSVLAAFTKESAADESTGDIRGVDPKGVLLAPDT